MEFLLPAVTSVICPTPPVPLPEGEGDTPPLVAMCGEQVPSDSTIPMQFADIASWLRESDPARLAGLWQEADQTRQRFVGGQVHSRGLIELSNYCVRLCALSRLAGGKPLPAPLPHVGRRGPPVRHQAVEYGYGTVVLQSGEDPGLRPTG